MPDSAQTPFDDLEPQAVLYVAEVPRRLRVTAYAVGRMYADARVTRIYGGTSEIMEEIIGKGMGLG